MRRDRQACCDDMRDTLNDLDRMHDPTEIRRELVPTFNGKDIRYCPYCGREIIRFHGVPIWFDRENATQETP